MSLRQRARHVAEPLAGVLLLVGAGLWLIAAHHPRKGLATIAAAFALAALARLLLSPHAAGLLVVRSRAVDVCVLGLLSAGVAALAVVQNFPSPGT